MNNKGLNAKIKIFIIVIYTIVLFSIILLSFGKSKINRFSEYQDKAYDDQIALNKTENLNFPLVVRMKKENMKKVHMIYKYNWLN